MGLFRVCFTFSVLHVYPNSRKSHSQHPEVKRIPPKNYAENYVYKPNKLRICRTK